MMRTIGLLMLGLGFALGALPQTEQVGADRKARTTDKLRLEYLHYRPAQWEHEKVTESEREPHNEGGLLYLYLKNVCEKSVDLKFWRAQGKDESHWRLNHFIAWDRLYDSRLDPGELTVLEINALASDFAPGRPFSFAYVDRTWRPAIQYKAELRADPVQIACIRMLPGLQDLEVHVRYEGTAAIRLDGLDVEGQATADLRWTVQDLEGPGHAIARLRLAEAVRPAALLVLRLEVTVGGKTRAVYAHRRAFEDFFPIGTWSGNDATYDLLHRHHIDTLVRGGSKTDTFYQEIAPRYGFRTMVHTGLPVNVDLVRDLGDHPAVLCWMLQDEPDWSIPSNIMLFADKTVRHYNRTKPTFITLCRNTRFFEYAPISDIPCMDHYSVTAPSSSRWPKFYGTYLEETAWYTRDLKAASEPKPIWIWSQAIASWSERPKRPVPTPNELAAQLALNLGRGAKGILWFNYEHDVAERYPEVRDAMRGWGRVMRLLREEFLGSEPLALAVEAPNKLDVAPLVTWDALILCLTNLDYQIHPEAYPFVTKTGVSVTVALPPWITPQSAVRLAPEGVTALDLSLTEGKARIAVGDIEACAVVVLHNPPESAAAYETAYRAFLAEE